MANKPLPVILRKFVFRDTLLPHDVPYLDQDIDRGQDSAAVRLIKIGSAASQTLKPENQGKIPGYFVMSTAPPNVEETKELQESEWQDAAQGVQEIARHLYDICHQSGEDIPNAELMIAVHGYNSSRSSVRDWYKTIFQYINRHDPAIPGHGNQVFIGYRWPSESIEVQRLGEALRSLPPLPRDLMLTGWFGALFLIFFELTTFRDTVAGVAIAFLLTLLLGLSTIIATLIILRMVVYFRDLYRAQNFGVLDLVELLRQIDRAMVNLKADELNQQQTHGDEPCPDQENPCDEATKIWQQAQRKIKLSFLGHSMGGFVVTNVVRILSDVFDSRSIDHQPPVDVGSVFQLERLILTSPDIPILTIVSSRTNFLSSSLRRFAESYLFSNEGDLALRVASATANYFAFPSSSQEMGYRLGNVALKSSHGDPRDYGIINLSELDGHFLYDGSSIAEAVARNPSQAMDHLFLTYNRFRSSGYNTLAKLWQKRIVASQPDFENNPTEQKQSIMTIADLFTYFDCTDYKDVTWSLQGQSDLKPKGLLTRANRKKALGWWDYFWLMVDGMLGKRDVHGGYFQGKFTQEMIYRIAFLGFTGYLKTLDDDPTMAFDAHVALSKLHMRCQELGIQSFLSPIRYRVNIQGQNISDNKQELLEVIDQESTEILQSDKMMAILKNEGFEVIEK
ncbi:alpha/beta hydrolase [Leptothoe sp. PORK10 BA2]|uniref:alpha/beta hydrolase n=1 Tax=Leptothoe sp. PORK10 BA2 TaxID=3110254 RepID=UPI002B210983|nr:alpha/beta hydrolase [Leptothoe sp. PORK10 BA2]MEA5464188.1 alpha/beta hydrolase [Leptothoe sp. PORK10 BA2]